MAATASPPFALPDLRGRTVVSAGQGPGLSNQFLGSPTGVPQVSLNVNQIPAHDHTLPGGGVTGFTGGNQPFTTVQPEPPLNYVINEQGIFPTRDGGGPTNFPFLGQLDLFAGNYSLGGAANANGQVLSINQNQALFSILGTTYGGDGITTFALPDLRGRTAIGVGQGPGLSNRNLGDRFGQETTTLTVSQLPQHVHTLPGGGGGSLTEPMLGQISLFAGNFAPSGWQFADGQILPISQNTALFSILGTTYGGNGQNTFELPDLQGRTIIGDRPRLRAARFLSRRGHRHRELLADDRPNGGPRSRPPRSRAREHPARLPGAAGLLLASRRRRRSPCGSPMAQLIKSCGV